MVWFIKFLDVSDYYYFRICLLFVIINFSYIVFIFFFFENYESWVFRVRRDFRIFNLLFLNLFYFF